MKNKSILALAVLSATMVGCGSSSDSNDSVVDEGVFTPCAASATECTLSGVLKEDFTLKAGVEYTMDDVFQVGEGNVEIESADDIAAIKAAGVTLTIEPGVHVKASDDGVLLVTRGSKLMAVGTKAEPITFSSLDDDFDGTGEWGGVIVQGFAPHYGAGNTGFCGGEGVAVNDQAVCNVAGEGGDFVGNFGGGDVADNSGKIKYFRIAEGGKVAGPNNEVNGLTVMGVGHATELEYIQVHGNLDDAVEWFGGTVNLKHAVLTNNDDDDLDYDEGYQGNIQHVLIIKDQDPARTGAFGSNDPRGIEGNSSDEDYVPQTKATIANATVYGSIVSNAGGEPGVRLRGSLTTDLYNTVVANFTDACVRIDYSDTDGDETTAKEPSVVNLTNVLASDCATTFNKEAPDSQVGLVEEVAAFDAAWALTNTAATVTAPTITAVDNGSGFAFDATTYIGAVEPGTAAASAWYADWIIPGSLDQQAQ